NLLTPTLMASLAEYKLGEYAKPARAWSAAGGVVVRPFPTLSVDAQAQWVRNKVYGADMRFFVRASYWFSERLSIF
ncbi:MAG: hypothetical protein WD295_02690, partial [Bacteroidota bacterium]